MALEHRNSISVVSTLYCHSDGTFGDGSVTETDFQADFFICEYTLSRGCLRDKTRDRSRVMVEESEVREGGGERCAEEEERGAEGGRAMHGRESEARRAMRGCIFTLTAHGGSRGRLATRPQDF